MGISDMMLVVYLIPEGSSGRTRVRSSRPRRASSPRAVSSPRARRTDSLASSSARLRARVRVTSSSPPSTRIRDDVGLRRRA